MRVCHGNVSLFHGTTAAAGSEVATTGFRPVSVEALALGYAERFGLSVETLLPALSFVRGRSADHHVYTSTRLQHAAGYALAAGEAERMLLDNAYDALFPQLSDDHRSPRKLRWMHEQLGEPSPVVLVLWLPLDDVPEGRRFADETELMEALCVDPPDHEVKLAAAEADTARMTLKVVDFCACRPMSHPECARYVECPVCREARLRAGGVDGPDLDDWFICLGPWRRADGSIDSGEAGLLCPDCLPQ